MRYPSYIAVIVAALFILPADGLGQNQAQGAAPLPVTLGIRDANTPPTPERIPKPFVPGSYKPSAAKKNKTKSTAKPKTQAMPKSAPPESAAASTKTETQKPVESRQAPFEASAAPQAPPLVTPPSEKISPIVPYVDDLPQAADQKANQDDFKSPSQDVSSELSPAPAPASEPGAMPEPSPAQGQPQATPQTPAPAPDAPKP